MDNEHVKTSILSVKNKLDELTVKINNIIKRADKLLSEDLYKKELEKIKPLKLEYKKLSDNLSELEQQYILLGNNINLLVSK